MLPLNCPIPPCLKIIHLSRFYQDSIRPLKIFRGSKELAVGIRTTVGELKRFDDSLPYFQISREITTLQCHRNIGAEAVKRTYEVGS